MNGSNAQPDSHKASRHARKSTETTSIWRWLADEHLVAGLQNERPIDGEERSDSMN